MPYWCSTAASGNILESRWRICDAVENTHGLFMYCGSAHPARLTSVRPYFHSACLTPSGPEAIVNTIGLVKVHLVGYLSANPTTVD